MIDYTRPGRGPAPDDDLDAVLRTASDHVERLVGRSATGLADPAGELQAWYDTVRAVADACVQASVRKEVPSPARLEALEWWLVGATDCLRTCRRLLRAARRLAEPPLTDGEVYDQYLGLLELMHVVHEEADRFRRVLAVRRDGIPPQQAAARFVRGRAAHRELARRALRLLHDDERRDEWSYREVFLTQRLAEYGGDLPGEAAAARDRARRLAQPGRALDDAQRAQMRSAEAALATHVNTGGVATRATGVTELVRQHRAVREEAPEDPLAAARYGAELLRAIMVGEAVDGLDVHDAVEALETAVRTMDPDAPEWPECLAARALARAQTIGSWAVGRGGSDAVVRELDAVRLLLPPGHPLLINVVVTLAQLLSRRGTDDGTLSDVRSALALLRRVRAQHLADPLERLVVDTAFAQVHSAFHYHAGADDADCTGTGDEAAPADDRTGHAAHTHRLLRRCVDRAREMAAAREDHSPEMLALVQHFLGWALLMTAACPDGPGAGPHRGDARFSLVAEARTVLTESLTRTDERSPQRAGRELLLHMASFVEALRQPAAAAGNRTAQARALARLAERSDVVDRPALRDTVLAVHACAESLLAAPPGGTVPAERAQRLRQLEASVAAEGDAVHATAVDLRMHLARAYRSGDSDASGLTALLTRAAMPGASPAGSPDAAERLRSRRLGREALGLLARRALVQEIAADAVLTADQAGPLSREVAAWCVADGDPAEALEVLERGRALALHTEMTTVDVRRRLTELGRTDLADAWAAWRGAALPTHPRDTAAGTGAGAGTGRAGDARDPYTEHPVPERLGARVRAVLEEHGALDHLLAAVPAPEIAAALRTTGNDELVYLLPTQGPPDSGGALRVGRDGRVRWTALRGLADTTRLDAYLGALELLLSAPRSEAVESAWEAELRQLCDWAGTAVMEPLLRDLGRGTGPGDVPRLVLVPLATLAAVPWSAARLPGTAGGRPVRAVDRLALSTAPSARMFTAAAGRPAVRAEDSALLILGLTGAEARVSSSRALHRLYPNRRLLAPAPDRPSGRPTRPPDGTTRPAEILDEIRRACREHGVVDISAHLLPDPSDSWRSHLAFGTVLGPDGTVAQDVDRLSVQTIAAQRFPVPPAGPGLCVSLASCMNSLPRRHHDESFTMAAAFLAGGASSVLGSLWRVRLHATALLDLLFHHWLRSGDAPVDALRRAQLWMTDPDRTPPGDLPPDARRLAAELLDVLTAAGHDPADPALWAGLVAVGR
ncbi:CHAT domain-containing protein [Streptomyces sp. NPDC126497]|uniref:CHAT domain-containing protein n=1 Tax=Streptomyces sp. NPDC126497 TaxID=3155313 RepID=UPI0033299427